MIRNEFVSNSSSSSYIVIENDKSKFYTKEEVQSFFIQTGELHPNFKNESFHVYFPDKQIGNTEFGWQWIKWKTLGDKLNFVAIQLGYMFTSQHQVINRFEKINQDFSDRKPKLEFDKCYTMFANVCKKYGIEAHLQQDLFSTIISYDHKTVYLWLNNNYYIDHQSSYEEGANIEMFESETALENFLFNKESAIYGGNDNEEGYATEEEYRD